MKIDPTAAAAHDEVVEVTSDKGDVAKYKVNHLTKKVEMETKLGDGNDHQWKLVGAAEGIYHNLMERLGRAHDGSKREVVSEPVDLESVKPSVEV